jgi:integrase
MREPKPIRVTVIRYVAPDGRRCSKGTAGAKRVKERSDTYYAWLPVAGKSTRVSLETTDLGQAWITLRAKQRELRDAERGITDPTTDHAARPLADHIDAWLAHVAARGTSAKQLQLLRRSVEMMARLARPPWTLIVHIAADATVRALAALGELKDERYPDGRGAQTRNHYLSHLRQFARWATDDGRLLRFPLGMVRPANVRVDRRHDRRCPTDDEVRQLLDYLYGVLYGPTWPGETTASTRPARIRRGMTGPCRAMGYQVAMATGFRASELRSLSRESFDLEHATATIQAAYDKRRRPTVQPIPAWLVDELRTWFAGGGGCWKAFPASGPGKLLKADLEAAGVPWSVPGPDGPLYFDMHSLRVWYCSQIASQPGVSPKVMMTLCRHSTAQLTLATYAKARDADVRASVAQLPSPPRPS